MSSQTLRQAGLWCRYADSEDAAAKMILKKPPLRARMGMAATAVHLYPEGDFSVIGSI